MNGKWDVHTFDPEASPPYPEGGHQFDAQNCWSLVLAGGGGTRLACLTYSESGVSVPKQYCSLLGGRSLLGDALARAEALAPRGHVVTVVARQHEHHWRRELNDWPNVMTVVQPRNRGTGAGILMPVLSIIARDLDAQVIVMPSDHFTADEGVLIEGLQAAQQVAARSPDRVLLVGIQPDGLEVDNAWIVPGEGVGPQRSVHRIVERPDLRTRAQLLRDGALWDSSFMVGSADAFLRLYAERQPGLLAAFFEADVETEPKGCEPLYGVIPNVDFHRDVLIGSEAMVDLFIVPTCGWTDLDTPPRVAQLAAQRNRNELRKGSLAAAASARSWPSELRR